uniref:GATA-type domain-containing protein n=1 Tax=Ananas comosus var. bracteatus TaxID=296719 RepID=A0A6V7P011_ANACO|nr:unnamed protein product [Ananas comosus var. bracteatus]
MEAAPECYHGGFYRAASGTMPQFVAEKKGTAASAAADNGFVVDDLLDFSNEEEDDDDAAAAAAEPRSVRGISRAGMALELRGGVGVLQRSGSAEAPPHLRIQTLPFLLLLRFCLRLCLRHRSRRAPFPGPRQGAQQAVPRRALQLVLAPPRRLSDIGCGFASHRHCRSSPSVVVRVGDYRDRRCFGGGRCRQEGVEAGEEKGEFGSGGCGGGGGREEVPALRDGEDAAVADGPMGPKTLCNACGVRFKSGRLVPEYRPAASPTFVLSKHSNSHRKVLELRRQKELQQLQLPPPPPQQQQQHHLLHPRTAAAAVFDAAPPHSAADEFLIHHHHHHHHLGHEFRQLL